VTSLAMPGVQERTERSQASTRWQTMLYCLPLLVILLAQAVYTIRLIPVGYLSTDEARYIVAGHVLLNEMVHGGGSPYYETFFSGAPDVYSPLAAIADNIGGVVAVRLMSAVFMLVATSLLFLTSQHLFGYLAALCSAGLFAGLGMTQVVGRNAIYDAMAFMLIAAATYCAVRARDGDAKWLLLTPLVLLIAYFTKYMTLLFDPVVIFLASAGLGSWRRVVKRLLVLGLTTGLLLLVSIILAGGAFLKGMIFSVFARQAGNYNLLGATVRSDHFIVTRTFAWMGALVVLSLVSVLVALFSPEIRRRHGPVLLVCAGAGLFVMAEALHLHAAESMRRHDDLSAWFAAIPAGYALSVPAQICRQGIWKKVLAGAAIFPLAAVWALYAQLPATFTRQLGYDTGNLGNPAPLGMDLKPYLELPGGVFLLSGLDNYSTIYEDHLIDLPWYSYATDDNYVKYPIPGAGGDWSGQISGAACRSVHAGCVYLEGPAAYRAAIKAHAFAVIELSRDAKTAISTDAVIAYTVRYTSGYVLALHEGNFRIWIYAPDYERKLSPGASSGACRRRPGCRAGA
jgi:4-amino-4-deoxy-L-arabinose transferase-like glycosyltransferase